MFDQLRDALRALRTDAPVGEQRASVSGMRDALVHAKLHLKDLGEAIRTTEARLATEEAEYATVTRRRDLAAGVGDEETVRIAERFATQHAERVEVLRRKRDAQREELALAEREYAEMSATLKRAMAGLPLGAGGADADAAAWREVEEALGSPRDGTAEALDAMSRAQSRAAREAVAADRLAALKRQLGRDDT